MKGFEVVGPYCLRVEFADGLERTINFRPVLEGELYGPLRDLSVFNSVSLVEGQLTRHRRANSCNRVTTNFS
ncbi:MAG: DUF2442 domain-containing protein [Candidatus Rokubacteria bacterium]|nr:DUF2442 domain-containing protein [Candidatus Rokubacteria bacterium]